MGNVHAREQDHFAESTSDRAAREGGVQVNASFQALHKFILNQISGITDLEIWCSAVVKVLILLLTRVNKPLYDVVLLLEKLA